MKIAFLGLGHMGRELAAHAIDAGHSLIVWNRTTSATDELVGRGAERAERAESPSAAKAATDKLVNNLGLAVTMQGVVEALRLGHSGGLSTDQVLAALDKSMLSAIAAMKGDYILSDNYSDTQFSAGLLSKDARLMTQTSRYPLPVLAAAHEALDNVTRGGHGDDDFSVIARSDATA